MKLTGGSAFVEGRLVGIGAVLRGKALQCTVTVGLCNTLWRETLGWVAYEATASNVNTHWMGGMCCIVMQAPVRPRRGSLGVDPPLVREMALQTADEAADFGRHEPR